jgi:hypothetical protein
VAGIAARTSALQHRLDDSAALKEVASSKNTNREARSRNAAEDVSTRSTTSLTTTPPPPLISMMSRSPKPKLVETSPNETRNNRE